MQPKLLTFSILQMAVGQQKGESGFERFVPAAPPSKGPKSAPSQVGEETEMSAESVKVLMCGSGAPVFSPPCAPPVLVMILLQHSSSLS